MRFKTSLVLGLLLVALGSTPAFATFHDIKVKEVFAGSAAHPTAQYVMVQAWRDLQDEVQGHSVLTFDATGAPTGTFTFSGPVPNDADQMTIIVATPDAAAIFGFTADLAMTPVLSPLGGKVCWEGSTPDDCVSWGNYSGDPTGVGTPYNAAVGLIPGYAIQRRLDICMVADHLDQCDDTDDSEDDWITVIPHPLTNPGVPGTTPPATCGNGTLEGLEGCDDNDTDDGDGCSAICHVEPAPYCSGEPQGGRHRDRSVQHQRRLRAGRDRADRADLDQRRPRHPECAGADRELHGTDYGFPAVPGLPDHRQRRRLRRHAAGGDQVV